ncbi:MAG: TonB-dependent receptor [Pseudomonadota bacterium]
MRISRVGLTATSIFALSIGATSAQPADPAPTPVGDGIVVTATPLERTTDEVAAPITVFGRDDIVRGSAPTLGALLKDELGVTHSSFAPGASRPIIRGLDNFRIRIQENGIGTHDVSALSEDHAITVDPLSATQVEVIRGPATLRYGSEAIGGLVSVLNNRIPQSAPEKGYEGEVYGAFDSVSDGFEGSAMVDFAVGQFAGHLDAFARDSDDYDIPDDDDTQANTFVESSGISGGGSFLFDNGFIGASVSYFDSEYGIPGEEAVARDLFLDMEQTKVSAAAEFYDLGSVVDTFRVQAGYSDYTHDEVRGDTGFVGSTFDNEVFEARTEVVHAPIGLFEGAIGLQGSTRDLSSSGEGGELIAPATDDRLALFVFEEVALSEGVVLQMGGRVEHVEVDGFGVRVNTFTPAPGTEIDDFGRDEDLSFTPISASASLLFDVANATKLGVTAQYVERAPSLLELFAKGPHESTETFEIGDPDLDKETAISLELTAKKTTGAVRYEAAAFYTEFEDFIFKRLTGVECGEEFDTCGVEDELTQVVYSAEDATFTGLELAGEWDAFSLHGGILGLSARFDMVRAEFDDSGDVPRIPPMRFGVGTYYTNGGFNSAIDLLIADEQDDTAEFESETKGYIDLTASASYVFEQEGSDTSFEVGLVGTNLLDDDIRNHSSFKKEDVLQPGASVRLFGRVVF